ncbi:hypothetical protein FC24_GL001790 [Loigolactobacillus rennini DSM 20253]|uniref:Uncharacterized protein n=1 Tax=Loigolactobacillus rennini DSM 20253 TaxID=1423796 RepID=A0A0R2D9A9_9LACO|nr:hypothetical protein FC24_GL001790 [Loigolactobacillus rennini DSM 20253]
MGGADFDVNRRKLFSGARLRQFTQKKQWRELLSTSLRKPMMRVVDCWLFVARRKKLPYRPRLQQRSVG